MASFTLTFDTDNAAFEDDMHGEIARILRDVADSVEAEAGGDLHRLSGRIMIRDINGNRVGSFGCKS